MKKIYHTYSSGICAQEEISILLSGKVHKVNEQELNDSGSLVCWGEKKNTRIASDVSKRMGVSLIRLEDGFFSWLGHPVKKGRRLSLVADPVGIFYQSLRPSGLEEQLLERKNHNLSQTDKLLQIIREYRITKYNSLCSGQCNLIDFALVIDQTFGDMSVEGAQAEQSDFDLMLECALEENPEKKVIVRAHPDVLLGKKQGWLVSKHGVKSEALRKKYAKDIASGRLTFSTKAINPVMLIQQASKLYTVSSQMGFEALIHGTPVVCFGIPFYSGWGLTDDRKSCPRRTQKHTVESLFAAACIEYSRYWNPETGKRCEMEEALDLIVNQVKQQRNAQQRLNSEQHVSNSACSEMASATIPKKLVTQPTEENIHIETIYAVGFSLWKRAFIKNFTRAHSENIQFVSSVDKALKAGTENDAVLVWGRKRAEGYSPGPGKPRLLRMEDGFIRSVGLGSDFKRPWSLVVDSRGIYFDPTQPSDLEHFLQTYSFSEEDEQRAQALIEKLRATKISKYNDSSLTNNIDKNVGCAVAYPTYNNTRSPGKPEAHPGVECLDYSPDGAKCLSSLPLKILVPGQVEDDASIQYGCIDIKTNLDLLQEVRRLNPGAWIIYKPHPDVLAGNRQGKLALQQAQQYADEVVTESGIYEAIALVDQVHTMTSLAGFEALLAGKDVYCYGIPFYANWGLTKDRHLCQRRDRSLNLQQLVFAVLCLYPSYVHWNHGFYTTPEAVIDALESEKQAAQQIQPGLAGWFSRKKRKFTFIYEALKGS